MWHEIQNSLDCCCSKTSPVQIFKHEKKYQLDKKNPSQTSNCVNPAIYKSEHLDPTNSAFVALASEWRRNRAETGGEVIVELKSQWRPSQSRKESILKCLFMGMRSFIYKSKGRIRSMWSDQEISDLLDEGRIGEKKRVNERVLQN